VACTLRAFGHIQAQRPDATLTVVGTGSQDASLRRLTAALGLHGVAFVGRVPPADMPRYYAEADIYLQSPDIDNMPLSVLEAFSSGLPVVSTEVGGVPAILTNEVHGLLTPRGDDRRLAIAALRLLEEPGLAVRLARAARASTEAYAWHPVRDRWLSAYRRLSRAPLPAVSPLETA
jgi:glycosyltransferase involved in cell wall biosynthesis